MQRICFVLRLTLTNKRFSTHASASRPKSVKSRKTRTQESSRVALRCSNLETFRLKLAKPSLPSHYVCKLFDYQLIFIPCLSTTPFDWEYFLTILTYNLTIIPTIRWYDSKEFYTRRTKNSLR